MIRHDVLEADFTSRIISIRLILTHPPEIHQWSSRFHFTHVKANTPNGPIAPLPVPFSLPVRCADARRWEAVKATRTADTAD